MTKHDIPAVIMTIDFEKCFDRIEHKVIIGALKYFGFGDNYVHWISIVLNHFELATQNCSFISE